MDEAFNWMIAKSFLCIGLTDLVEDERQGRADYDALMMELKELSACSLYQASGGMSDIRCYEDMLPEKVEAIMKKTNTGKVWRSERGD